MLEICPTLLPHSLFSAFRRAYRSHVPSHKRATGPTHTSTFYHRWIPVAPHKLPIFVTPTMEQPTTTYYQWPGVWNILTFGYILPQPLHSRPPILYGHEYVSHEHEYIFYFFIVQLWKLTEASWSSKAIVSRDWNDCHIEVTSNCTEFDRVNAIDLGFRRSYLISPKSRLSCSVDKKLKFIEL